MPNAPQNLELIGTVFEALSAETKNHVIPAYFNIALTHKFTRNTDSEEILNIVFDNINNDLRDTTFYEQLRYPLILQILALIGDYESFLTKREKIVNSSIKDFLKAIKN